MKIKLHLVFDGQASQALEFYKELFDGTVTMALRFGDVPEMCCHPATTTEEKNRIVHASLVIPNNVQIEMCDTTPNEPLTMGNNMLVSIYEPDAARARHFFDALAEGGNVVVPYSPMPWAANYGRLTDRFGIDWQILEDE